MAANSPDMWKGVRDFDALHGWAFRIAKTPSGQARDRDTDEVLPDHPDRWSIVTPENESAWKDWEPGSPKAVSEARSSWNDFIGDPEADYKKHQILRSARYGKASTYARLDAMGRQWK